MFSETRFSPNVAMPYFSEILRVDDEIMKKFCNAKLPKKSYKTTNLNPFCIDWILTNKSRSFQITCALEAGLSDFHRMTVFVAKM